MRTTIEDTGGARVTDSGYPRDFDAANGLYQRLGFPGTAVIRYHIGWAS